MTIRTDRGPGPFHIDTDSAVFGPDGSTTPKTITPYFYSELDREFDGFSGCALIARHEFSEDWKIWEMHPAGDEIVYLLSGDIDFVLWCDNAETPVRLHEPNSYIVVPRGVWHTARPRNPSAALFITPGEGTRHADTPPKG